MTTSGDTTRAPVDADPHDVADLAATNGLLRCWVRENAITVPGDVLELALPAAGVRLHAPVLYWSPTGHHRFGTVRWDTGTPASAVMIAALLAAEAAPDGAGHPGNTDLVGRVADSHSRVAEYVRHRSTHPEEPEGTTPFLTAEQALVLGHPLHPTPKSRPGLSPSEADRFSPELRGSFPLHWFAADLSIVSSDGSAAEAIEAIAPATPPGTVPVPAHPWQARELRARPGIRRLLEAGLLHDLGESGQPWSPTASLRTVYRSDAPVMLKFSLSLPITNSVRENQRKELRRGAEIDRLLDAGLAGELAEAHPGFGIVRDPSWLAVDVDDADESGLELVVRDNPFAPHDRVACVAGLVAERPDLGRSGLAEVVTGLVTSTGHDPERVAAQWCARYFDAVIAPVLWLYRTYGLGLEAHQQNTLVALDEHGWPAGGWYRDNQGYYLSRQHNELKRFVPEVTAGENVCDDALIDERLGYYVGINNLLGLIGAFGSQGIADEHALLGIVRARLDAFNELALARMLAHSPTVRCKANLLTRLDGLDELVGPVETQSVYRDIPNPIAEASTS